MNIRIPIAGILSVACSLSAHAQDPIADICAEFLAPDQWPEPMSEQERATLDASMRETSVDVSELVSQLPDKLEPVDVSEPADSIESRNERIGYGNLPSIEDWQNPIVAITVEGAEVRSSALESGSLYGPVGALQCILANLPASAWPLGRMVQAGPPSLVRSSADLVPIWRNQEAAEAIFAELRIEVFWWAM